MSDPYRKVSTDRYSLLREHQILDYLNQRHAPVPRVILSHVAEGYLDMSHGGQDLAAWVRSAPPPDAALALALADALEALMAVARLGVWHLDIAPRNFVIQADPQAGRPRVQVIDFSNAVTDQFPLQKPLWMLPAPDQHPELRQALAADWAAFFERHQMPPPRDWQDTFDVPVALYQDDWGRGFQVEVMALRWCVLAHGCAGMLLQFADWRALPRPAIEALLDLREEARAESGLQAVAVALRRLGASAAQTPRPRATTARPAEPSPPTSPTRPVSPAPQDRAATPTAAPTPPPKPPPTPPPKPPLTTPPTPATPTTAAVPDPGPGPAVRPRRFSFGLALGLLLVAAGWWHIDGLYTQHQVLLWGWGWRCLLGGFAATLAMLIAMAWQRRLQPWLGLVLLAQLATQALLLLELWVRHIPLL